MKNMVKVYCVRHECYEDVESDEHINEESVKRSYVYDCNQVKK